MHCFKAFLFSLTVLVAATSLGAKHIAFTDPEKTDPDFQVQGEYVDRIGRELPVSVQVVALGKHEFQGVFYSGGLACPFEYPQRNYTFNLFFLRVFSLYFEYSDNQILHYLNSFMS